MTKERTTQDILAGIRKELLGLEQQAMTSSQVQSAIWKLWGFVRDSQNSLDSERCCLHIQDVVNDAVAGVNKRAEVLAVELDAIQQELRDSKKEVKRLTKELEKSCEEMAELKSEIHQAEDDIDRLQALLSGKKTQDDTITQHPDAA